MLTCHQAVFPDVSTGIFLYHLYAYFLSVIFWQMMLWYNLGKTREFEKFFCEYLHPTDVISYLWLWSDATSGLE